MSSLSIHIIVISVILYLSLLLGTSLQNQKLRKKMEQRPTTVTKVSITSSDGEFIPFSKITSYREEAGLITIWRTDGSIEFGVGIDTIVRSKLFIKRYNKWLNKEKK